MEKQHFQTELKLSVIEDYLCCFGDSVLAICARESDCLISPEDAYARIRSLWLELKDSQPEIAIYLKQTDSN